MKRNFLLLIELVCVGREVRMKKKKTNLKLFSAENKLSSVRKKFALVTFSFVQQFSRTWHFVAVAATKGQMD